MRLWAQCAHSTAKVIIPHLNTPSLYMLHFPESWSQDTQDVYFPVTASFLIAQTPFGLLLWQSSAIEDVELVEFPTTVSGAAISSSITSIPSLSRECSVQSSGQTAAKLGYKLNQATKFTSIPTEQSSVENSWLQSQTAPFTGSSLQVPCPEQSFGHATFWQVSPFQPFLHAHLPSLHTPLPEQSLQSTRRLFSLS